MIIFLKSKTICQIAIGWSFYKLEEEQKKFQNDLFALIWLLIV